MWSLARDAASDSKLREALLALAAGLAVSVPTVLVSVLVVRSYSTPLFLGTPFSHVRAAHLDGYFQATWGRFDLEELPGGRTLLVGTTRYQVRMYPQAYWALFADAIVERIHMRVLRHIEGLSER